MLIPQDEAELFLATYLSLIAYAAHKLGGVAGIEDIESFIKAPLEDKADARDAMLDHAHIIEEFADENPIELHDVDLAEVRNWKCFLHDTFIIERDLKKYTVLSVKTFCSFVREFSPFSQLSVQDSTQRCRIHTVVVIGVAAEATPVMMES